MRPSKQTRTNLLPIKQGSYQGVSSKAVVKRPKLNGKRADTGSLPASTSMTAMNFRKESTNVLNDDQVNAEYLPMLSKSVTKNTAPKDFSARLASEKASQDRFAQKYSKNSDKFEVYGGG